MDIAPRPVVLRVIVVSAVLLAFALTPTAATADDWVARGYWPFDEATGQVAQDLSGNGNHGQLGSSPAVDANDPAWVAGRFGGGLGFAGNQFVQIADTPALESDRITVAAYFRGAASPGVYRYILAKGAASCNAASYGFYSGANGGLGFYISNGSSYAVSPLAAPSVWNGAWHHAAGTFDGSTVRLFLDGNEVGAGTPTKISISYGLPLGDNGYIGTFRGDCDLTLTGELDEVMVLTAALAGHDLESIVQGQPVPVRPSGGSRTSRQQSVGRPKLRCVKRKRSRRQCRLKVSFAVKSSTRVRLDVEKLRRRRATKLGALTRNVKPPSASIRLPKRLGRRKLGPGRYRVTLLELDGRVAHRVASSTARVRKRR
jgi:Concanavalin A-like lectin/glucanases superfamily